MLCTSEFLLSVSLFSQTGLSQEVLDKQDKIFKVVLAINNMLKRINASIREICDAIKLFCVLVFNRIHTLLEMLN